MNKDATNWHILTRLMKHKGATLRNVSGSYVFQLSTGEEFVMRESLCEMLDQSWQKWGSSQTQKNTKGGC